MRPFRLVVCLFGLLGLLGLLGGCGKLSLSVHVAVQGLQGGALTLQNNGGDDLTVNADGVFRFPTQLSSDSSYRVTIVAQPAGQVCTVARPEGRFEREESALIDVICAQPATYRIGGALTGLTSGRRLILKNNDGDALVLTADGSFSFATALAMGSAYSISVDIQPVGQTCSVEKGSGNVAGTDISSVSIACAANPVYVFVVSGSTNSLLSLALGADGMLPVTAGVTATGNGPRGVAIDGRDRFVYVSNSVDGTVSQYRIGAGGVLTANGVTTVGVNPRAIVTDPSGAFLYVANTDDATISQFAIAADGTLAALGEALSTGSPASSMPVGLRMDPAGKRLYVIDAHAAVLQYIVGTDGRLSPMSPVRVPILPDPVDIAIDPGGRNLYTVHRGDQQVLQFSIDAQTGAISNQSVSSTSIESYPSAMVLHPSGRFAFVTQGSGVRAYSIDAGGALVQIDTPALGAGNIPPTLAMGPGGRILYVPAIDARVTQFSIGTDGVMSAMTPPHASYTGEGRFWSMAITH